MITFPSYFPVTSHTRHVGPNSTFVAISGNQQDGAKFIPEALEKGAKKIVVASSAQLTPELILLIKSYDAELVRTDNPRRALAYLSAKALNFPAQKLHIIGITGTVGKTTTTMLAEHIFKQAGYKTALLSSLKNWIGSTEFETNLTTQHPDYIQVFLDLCVKNKIDFVFMEAAAQAFSLYRTNSILFDGFIFTNFGMNEHGEFYISYEEYLDAKLGLLRQVKPHHPIVLNNDDIILNKLASNRCESVPFGFAKNSLISIQVKESSLIGITGSLYFEKKAVNFNCPALAGKFNAYNIMASAALAYSFNIEPKIIAAALQNFPGVTGRLEKYLLPNNAYAVIDCAYTPPAFEGILSLLRELTDNLIVIFGCGGDRDASKRPLMGALAARYADKVILTTDNPRSEDPLAIISAIRAGISAENYNKISIELDREKAIRDAYSNSGRNAIIALLGKGQDQAQIINGIYYPFSERAIIKSLFQAS